MDTLELISSCLFWCHRLSLIIVTEIQEWSYYTLYMMSILYVNPITQYFEDNWNYSLHGNHVSWRVFQGWSYWLIILCCTYFSSFFYTTYFSSLKFSFWGLEYFVQHQLQKLKQAVALWPSGFPHLIEMGIPCTWDLMLFWFSSPAFVWMWVRVCFMKRHKMWQAFLALGC
jgi:hypothetical protein